MTYSCIGDYLKAECEANTIRLEQIEAIITALYTALLESVGKAGIKKYKIDSGQSIIETEYRSPAAIKNDIEALEAIKQRLFNQCSRTRKVRLNPAKFGGYSLGRTL